VGRSQAEGLCAEHGRRSFRLDEHAASRSSCFTVEPGFGGGERQTVDCIKICSPDAKELNEWAVGNLGYGLRTFRCEHARLGAGDHAAGGDSPGRSAAGKEDARVARWGRPGRRASARTRGCRRGRAAARSGLKRSQRTYVFAAQSGYVLKLGGLVSARRLLHGSRPSVEASDDNAPVGRGKANAESILQSRSRVMHESAPH
jgi:hypothetical protein